MNRHKFLTLIGLLTVLVFAQNLTAQKKESLDNDQIKFTLPKDFEKVEKTALDFRFYMHNPEERGCCLDEDIYAYTNKTKSLEVMLGFIPPDTIKGTERVVREKSLPKIKLEIEKLANEKVKGIKWLKKESIVRNKKKWIHLIFQTPKTGDDRVYEFLIADYHAYLMVFAVSSDNPEYDKNKASITEIINSLKVDELLYGTPVGVPSN